MSVFSTFFRDRGWLVWLPVNLLFVLATARFGLGLPVDSAKYFSASQHFFLQGSWQVFDGTFFCDAAPLYPLLLLPAWTLPISPVAYAWVLNLLLLQVLLWQLWKLSSTEWWTFAALALFPLTVFPAYTQALSELPMMLLFYAIIIEEQSGNNSSWSHLKYGVMLGLLLLSRYAAWMLLPGLFLYWIIHRLPLKKWIQRLWLPLLLAGAWMFRNYTTCGGITGIHTLTEKTGWRSLPENMLAVFNADIGIAVQLMAFVALLVIAFVLNGKKNLYVYVVGGYLLFLLIQPQLPPLQVPRLLAPFWPLLLLPVLRWAIGRTNAQPPYWWWLLPLLLLAYGLNKANRMYQTGAGGYHSNEWQDAALQQYLHSLPEGRWCSNYPDMVWWMSGKQCNYSPFVNESKAQYSQRIGSGKHLLLWFGQTDRNHVMMQDTAFVTQLTSSWVGSYSSLKVFWIEVP